MTGACLLILAKMYMILKIELVIFKIIMGKEYCIVLYNDLVKSYRLYINVSKMQMQMFEMPNPKVIKRKKNTN